MRFNEDILRFMTVSVEAHEEGPSAMLQKRRPRRPSAWRRP
jgi:small subunit ribosomal protein S6